MNQKKQKTQTSHQPDSSSTLININDGYLYGASCRVCLETNGYMIAPCQCKGSSKFIHRTCLYEWLNHSKNPKMCEICLTPWNKELFPLYIRIFFRVRNLIYILCVTLSFLIGHQLFTSAEKNPTGYIAVFYYLMASLLLATCYISSFKCIRELYIFWKVSFTFIYWTMALTKTLEDEMTKEEMFYDREKWPKENRQIDIILIFDVVSWLIFMFIYSSCIVRNNGWRSMDIV